MTHSISLISNLPLLLHPAAIFYLSDAGEKKSLERKNSSGVGVEDHSDLGDDDDDVDPDEPKSKRMEIDPEAAADAAAARSKAAASAAAAMGSGGDDSEGDEG